MRAFSTFAAVVLLVLAAGGVVWWIAGFEVFKEMLLDGVPVFFDHGASQTQVPGRLLAAAVLAVPVFCPVGGVFSVPRSIEKMNNTTLNPAASGNGAMALLFQ